MGYRTSVIAKNDYVALSAVLKLEKGDRQEIRAYMEDLKERRVTSSRLNLEAPAVRLSARKGILREN